MRLREARLAPVEEGDWNAEQRSILAPMAARDQAYNIFRTMARHPVAMRAFMMWGNYILRDNTLPRRERELVILRVGFACRAGYEWAQHTIIGLRSGLSEAEVARLKAPADAAGWSTPDRALIDAVDELHDSQFISDGVWARLSEHFDEKQCMDVVYTTGQYTQVSMILNTFGVQLDPFLAADPDLAAFA